MELSSVLEDRGAEVVGPCPTLACAMAEATVEKLSAAILDLRLGRDSITPVARVLEQRRVPFFFYSGQSANDPIRTEWPSHAMVSKPALAGRLVEAIMNLLPARGQ
jgi:hypothetical protein